MWSNLEIKESISRLGFGGHSGQYFEWFWDCGRRRCHIYHPVDPPRAWIRFCEKFNIYLWGGDLEDEGVICARAACRPELLSCSQDHPLHNPPTSPLTENRLAVKSSQRERYVLHSSDVLKVQLRVCNKSRSELRSPDPLWGVLLHFTIFSTLCQFSTLSCFPSLYSTAEWNWERGPCSHSVIGRRVTQHRTRRG